MLFKSKQFILSNTKEEEEETEPQTPTNNNNRIQLTDCTLSHIHHTHTPHTTPPKRVTERACLRCKRQTDKKEKNTYAAVAVAARQIVRMCFLSVLSVKAFYVWWCGEQEAAHTTIVTKTQQTTTAHMQS